MSLEPESSDGADGPAGGLGVREQVRAARSLERTTAPPDPLSHGASQRTADTRLRLQADPGLPEG